MHNFEVLGYISPDSKYSTFMNVFQIFVSFCTKFRSAVSDNERRRANEEQAAARRRARDAAANKTRNGNYEINFIFP